MSSTADELLVSRLDNLSLNGPAKAPKKPTRTLNPADYLALQSARSSGSAGKYRTGKFSRDPSNVFKDLRASPTAYDEKIVVKRDVIVEKIVVDEDSEDDDQLISRGLLRGRVAKTSKKKEGSSRAAESILIEYASYSATGAGYECGASGWEDLHSPSPIRSNSIPSSFKSVGAKMTGTLASPPSAAPEDPRSTASTSTASIVDEEMPDTLVDFILQYTREVLTPAPAAPKQHPQMQQQQSPGVAASPGPVAAALPTTAQSAAAAAAPTEAAAAAATSVEAVLEAALHALLPEELLAVTVNSLLLSNSRLSDVVARNRPAKAKLKNHVGQSKIDQSMLSLCECIEEAKDDFRRAGKEDVESSDVLFHPNEHGFTLLHQALMGGPSELAQPYVVVEQQLLLPPRHLITVGLPWDMKNHFGETPLWWAVYGRKRLFVDYLLELGADPNCKTIRDRQDSALHIAARKGMTAIARSLISDHRCKIDMANGRGETPLFTAVLYNNQLVKRVQVDNIGIAESLLRAGANPSALDRKGNTIFHVAACAMDTPMLEMFARVIPDNMSHLLANAPNDKGARPLDFLRQHEGQIDEDRYRRCFFALLTCNAKCEVGERRRVQKSTVAPGSVGSGTVGRGSVFPGSESPGSVGSGTVGRGSVSLGSVSSGTTETESSADSE